MLFAADIVVDVSVPRGQITQIVHGDDEQIVGIPSAARIELQRRYTHLVHGPTRTRSVRQTQVGATSTNLIVVTDRRRHPFLLHPVEGAGLTLMRLTVAAPMVPRPIAATPSPAPPTAKELIEVRWQTKPLVRNSAYSVAMGKDSEDSVPVMVFDDGTQTYFSFPNNRPIAAATEQPQPDSRRTTPNSLPTMAALRRARAS